jgi:hypothetical protein
MVLSVGYNESQSLCQSWINQFGLTHPVLSDSPPSVSQLFIPVQGGYLYFPHNCVVDQHQIMRHTATGFNHSTIQNLILSLMEPEPAFDPEELDFGALSLGQIVARDLTIDNAGTGVLEINDIYATIPTLFTVNPTSGEIYAVNDELLVTVTLDAQLAGNIEEQLVIETSIGNFYVDLIAQVAGSGPFLWVDPGEVDFGGVEVGESEDQTVWAHNLGQETVNVTSISIPGPEFTVNPTSGTLAAGDSTEVTITFTPSGPDTLIDMVTFLSNGGDREVDVLAMGVQALIGGSVDTLDFGTVNVGGFQTRAFRIRNYGNGMLDITDVILEANIPNMSYNLQSTEVEPYDSTLCYLIWTPQSAGTLDGTITFQSNGGDLVIDLIGEAQSASVWDDQFAIPTKFALGQNFPNPFNSTTMIPYALPHSAPVQIAIYNTYGRQVHTIQLGEQPAGWHRAIWNGTNNHGSNVSAGIYFYRLLVDGRSMDLRKMLYLK